MATRAAKLDEQMAALLEKMDQQSEQLQLFRKEQAQRVDDIARKQMEVGEQVSAVEGNIDSMKTIVDGRLSSFERSLTAVERKTETLKQELRKELLQELGAAMSADASSGEVDGEGRAGGTSNGTEGSETIPRGGSDVTDHREVAERSNERLTAAGRGGTALFSGQQLQRPAPFDGKVAWDAYRAQFELLAEMNGWSDAEKAAHLAVSLRGAAATVLTNIPAEQRQNYLSLTAALETRLGQLTKRS